MKPSMKRHPLCELIALGALIWWFIGLEIAPALFVAICQLLGWVSGLFLICIGSRGRGGYLIEVLLDLMSERPDVVLRRPGSELSE